MENENRNPEQEVEGVEVNTDFNSGPFMAAPEEDDELEPHDDGELDADGPELED